MRTRHTIPSLLAAVLLSSIGDTAHGQQELMMSQYMFNGLFLNPAYAGSHAYATSSLMHRAQWTGVEGAPRTSLLAIDGPLMGEQMGLGFSMSHDQIGVTRDLEFAGHYAYHLRLGTGRLALGLKAGLALYSARLSDLVYWDANDEVFQNDIHNATIGKFGFGLYWYDAASFIGVSVPTIYAADKRIALDAAAASHGYFTQHYYVTAGRIFPLSEALDIKPSVLVKYEPQAPVEVDLNCNLLFRERLWAGLGYRTGDALVAMVEYQVSTPWRIGYAYDMTTSRLRGYSGGSHELMLGLDLGRELVKIKTPRYF